MGVATSKEATGTMRVSQEQILSTNPPKGFIDRFVEKHSVSLEEAQALWLELMRYLIVRASYTGQHSPSLKVDSMWHAFVLSTKAYREFCDWAFGYFIDHTPTPMEVCRPWYQNTLAHLEDCFGSYNAAYWPPLGEADCDSGGCGDCG